MNISSAFEAAAERPPDRWSEAVRGHVLTAEAALTTGEAAAKTGNTPLATAEMAEEMAAALAAAKSCDNGGEIGDGDEGRAAAVTTCLAAGDSCDCEGGQTDAGDSCCCGECCDAVVRAAADPVLVVCQLQLAAAEAGDGVEAAEEESCPLLLLRLPPLAAPEADCQAVTARSMVSDRSSWEWFE